MAEKRPTQAGIELGGHETQPVTRQLLNQADFVFTMTNAHRDAILTDRPNLVERVKLLSPDGIDVSDPIGCGMDEYKNCEREIERYLQSIIASIEFN